MKSLYLITTELDVLKAQVQSLQEINGSLISSVEQANHSFQFLLVILGLLGAVGTWFFKDSLAGARAEIQRLVNEKTSAIVTQEVEQISKRVSQQIQVEVQRDIATIKRVVERESVIDEVDIYHLLYDVPDDPERPVRNYPQEPEECEMLRQRGFEVIYPQRKVEPSHYDGAIVILDLVNLNPPLPNPPREDTAANAAKEAAIRQRLDYVAATLPQNSLLIIYFSGFSSALNKFKEDKVMKYYHMANNRISLMGAVVDSAYVARTLRP